MAPACVGEPLARVGGPGPALASAAAFLGARISEPAGWIWSLAREPSARAAQDRHGEGRVVLPRPKVPGGEAVLEYQASGRRLAVELSECVAAIEPEPDHDETIAAQVCGKAGEHGASGAWGKEWHDVAGAYYGVERLLALGGQVKLGEVGHEPGGTGMVSLGRVDQLRIDVDANHGMAAGAQFGADSARPATGIQHP